MSAICGAKLPASPCPREIGNQLFESLLLTAAMLSPIERMAPMPSPGITAKLSAPAVAANSKAAKDMNGYQPSLYKGPWYSASYEPVRRCIMKRESGFSYRAANPRSSARGAYQFLDNAWRISLTHLMIKESRQTKDGLIKDIKELRGKPIHHWNRYWQDRAFFTAWRHGAGKKHWYHWNRPCF